MASIMKLHGVFIAPRIDTSNTSSWKTKTGLSSTMVVAMDDLATPGARASAAMILTNISWNTSSSAPSEGVARAQVQS